MFNKRRFIAGLVLIVCLFAAGFMFGRGRRNAARREAAESAASAASASAASFVLQHEAPALIRL